MYFKDIESIRAEKITYDKNQKANARKRLDEVASKLRLKRKQHKERNID